MMMWLWFLLISCVSCATVQHGWLLVSTRVMRNASLSGEESSSLFTMTVEEVPQMLPIMEKTPLLLNEWQCSYSHCVSRQNSTLLIPPLEMKTTSRTLLVSLWRQQDPSSSKLLTRRLTTLPYTSDHSPPVAKVSLVANDFEFPKQENQHTASNGYLWWLLSFVSFLLYIRDYGSSFATRHPEQTAATTSNSSGHQSSPQGHSHSTYTHGDAIAPKEENEHKNDECLDTNRPTIASNPVRESDGIPTFTSIHLPRSNVQNVDCNVETHRLEESRPTATAIHELQESSRTTTANSSTASIQANLQLEPIQEQQEPLTPKVSDASSNTIALASLPVDHTTSEIHGKAAIPKIDRPSHVVALDPILASISTPPSKHKNLAHTVTRKESRDNAMISQHLVESTGVTAGAGGANFAPSIENNLLEETKEKPQQQTTPTEANENSSGLISLPIDHSDQEHFDSPQEAETDSLTSNLETAPSMACNVTRPLDESTGITADAGEPNFAPTIEKTLSQEAKPEQQQQTPPMEAYKDSSSPSPPRQIGHSNQEHVDSPHEAETNSATPSRASDVTRLLDESTVVATAAGESSLMPVIEKNLQETPVFPDKQRESQQMAAHKYSSPLSSSSLPLGHPNEEQVGSPNEAESESVTSNPEKAPSVTSNIVESDSSIPASVSTSPRVSSNKIVAHATTTNSKGTRRLDESAAVANSGNEFITIPAIDVNLQAGENQEQQQQPPQMEAHGALSSPLSSRSTRHSNEDHLDAPHEAEIDSLVSNFESAPSVARNGSFVGPTSPRETVLKKPSSNLNEHSSLTEKNIESSAIKTDIQSGESVANADADDRRANAKTLEKAGDSSQDSTQDEPPSLSPLGSPSVLVGQFLQANSEEGTEHFHQFLESLTSPSLSFPLNRWKSGEILTQFSEGIQDYVQESSTPQDQKEDKSRDSAKDLKDASNTFQDPRSITVPPTSANLNEFKNTDTKSLSSGTLPPDSDYDSVADEAAMLGASVKASSRAPIFLDGSDTHPPAGNLVDFSISLVDNVSHALNDTKCPKMQKLLSRKRCREETEAAESKSSLPVVSSKKPRPFKNSSIVPDWQPSNRLQGFSQSFMEDGKKSSWDIPLARSSKKRKSVLLHRKASFNNNGNSKSAGQTKVYKYSTK